MKLTVDVAKLRRYLTFIVALFSGAHADELVSILNTYPF